MNICKPVLLAFCALLAACRAAPPAEVPPFVGSSSLSEAFAEAAAQSGAPGVVAGLYEAGELVATFSWGLADTAARTPASPDLLFEIGSLSKHVTAIAILNLETEGRLALDGQIGAYVDSLPETWRSVTLKQLLSHTGGIPDYEAAAGYKIYEAPGNRDVVLASVIDKPLDFPPGTAFSYSNTGYYLLSLAIERVSGMPFATYLQRTLFAPAGMTDTELGPPTMSHRRAQGYKPGDTGLTAVPPIFVETTLGAGGIATTLADWGKWRRALRAEAIVDSAAIIRTTTPTKLLNGEDVNYGFGMIADRFRGERRETHTGQTAGFTCRFEHYPDADRSLLVLSNTYGGRLNAVARALAINFIPGLDYSTLPEQPADSSESRMGRAALQQAVLGGDDLSLLSEGMQAFATDDAYAPLRDPLKPGIESMTTFALVKREGDASSGTTRHVYRVISQEGTQYWILSMKDGLLIGLDWADR
ncbi:MAG: serine hydrolase domain-containing protein [Rhodothermales bacterium]